MDEISLLVTLSPLSPRTAHAAESLERQARAPIRAHQGQPASTGPARARGAGDCRTRRQQGAGATWRVRGGGERHDTCRTHGPQPREPTGGCCRGQGCRAFAGERHRSGGPFALADGRGDQPAGRGGRAVVERADQRRCGVRCGGCPAGHHHRDGFDQAPGPGFMPTSSPRLRAK